jgi:DNA gyrase subunit A
MGTKAEDYITDMFVASTHDYLLIFTNHGRVYWQKVYQLPAGSRQTRGKAMVNLVGALSEESVATVIPVREFLEDRYLLMATKNGMVKKTSLSEYSRPRATGIIGCGLEEGDELIGVKSTDGNQEIVLATAMGKTIRFDESEVRHMGRTARGVKGISLRDDDHVIALDLVTPGGQLLTVTESGYGKRTQFSDYPLQGRGGMGVINIRMEKAGLSVAVHAVEEEDDVIVVTMEGIVIRTAVRDITVMGRDTMGVIVQRPDEGDSVATVAKIAREQNGNDE